jgi:hypothetical protein
MKPILAKSQLASRSSQLPCTAAPHQAIEREVVAIEQSNSFRQQN